MDNIHIVPDLYSEKDRIKKYLRGKSFIAESIRQFDIEVKKINPSAETYENVLYAQKRQVMVNEY